MRKAQTNPHAKQRAKNFKSDVGRVQITTDRDNVLRLVGVRSGRCWINTHIISFFFLSYETSTFARSRTKDVMSYSLAAAIFIYVRSIKRLNTQTQVEVEICGLSICAYERSRITFVARVRSTSSPSQTVW